MKFCAVLILLNSFFVLNASNDVTDSIKENKQPRIVDIEGGFFSTPIFTKENNNIVIASHNKHVYFFNREGELINSHKSSGWIHATPNQLSDGTIGIGSYSGYFYFFDEDGHVETKTKPGGFIFTEPVEFGEHIAFGSTKGRVVLYHKDKDELSYVKLKRLVHGSPIVTSDSILVLGSNSGNLYYINQDFQLVNKFKTGGWIMHSKPFETFDNQIIVGSYDKHLYSLDSEGNLNWKFKTNGRIHSSPIQTSDSTIIFGSLDKYIYVLSPEGELINKIKTDKSVVSSPAIVNDSTVVIGSHDKHLYFIDNVGNLLNTYDAQGKIFSSPIVLPCGTIFCCTRKGKLSFLPPKFVEDLLNKQN